MGRSEPGIHEETLATGRIKIHLMSAGAETGHPVVFVHGNLSSSVFWRETMRSLGGYRTIALDLRGFGATESLPVSARHGARDFSDDVAAMITTLELPAVHLVGWSMGGGVVLQYLIDHPDHVSTVTLIDPVSPYGFGGTKGTDGSLCFEDGAGSGGGSANPQFVELLKGADRGRGDMSPRTVMNSYYFRARFQPKDEEELLDGMLSTRVGDDFYPGGLRPSANWPGFGPGERGVLNAMAPLYFNVTKIVELANKPPILWIRGAEDTIVSDHSMFDCAVLGQMGAIPDWPGEDICPPQPMVAQTRAVLQDYRSSGGAYREVVINDAAHSPHIEQPKAFMDALQEHLQS